MPTQWIGYAFYFVLHLLLPADGMIGKTGNVGKIENVPCRQSKLLRDHRE